MSNKEEIARLNQLRAEIAAERKKLKEEREASNKCTPELITSVSLAVQQGGIKLYTTDGRLINSLTWEELNQMRSETRPDNYLVTEGTVSPQTLFRETFQNFITFCNSIYLPKEVEDIKPEYVNSENIDPNTRAFIDMVLHYETYFENNPQWKKPMVRFLKWMCFLFKEDKVLRERVGWMFWWFIVKHGNKLIIWEPMYDPRHWTPFTDGDIVNVIEGPKIAKLPSPEEQAEVQRLNESLMRENLSKLEEMKKNGRQGAT